MGTTNARIEGLATSSPSAAESTEMAGVTTLSPRNIAAPAIPTRLTRTAPVVRRERRSSATRASSPPSPWLSKRRSVPTYRAVTTSSRLHTTREVTPSTAVRSSGPASPSIVRNA